MENFSRLELLIGKDGLEKLKNSHVAVFGVGGVGSYTVEALVRSGIGAIDLVDNDTYTETNLNRQLYATISTLGKSKVEVAKNRILDINPDAKVTTFETFFTPETVELFDFTKYDYIIDAIDTVVGKIQLVEKAKEFGVPIICSMGAGNKMNPLDFEVADISKTSVCPLAKVMRQELRKRGIKKVKVVYSKEIPIKPREFSEEAVPQGKHRIPGSNAFVPSVVGLIIASEVVKDLIKN